MCHRSVIHVAAGATWKLVIASAPWGVRGSHTTVIGAAGAIYVIGGGDNWKNFNDVWVSTDGGADWTGGCTRALRVLHVLAGTIQLLRAATEAPLVLTAVLGYSEGACRGTQEAL